MPTVCRRPARTVFLPIERGVFVGDAGIVWRDLVHSGIIDHCVLIAQSAEYLNKCLTSAGNEHKYQSDPSLRSHEDLGW